MNFIANAIKITYFIYEMTYDKFREDQLTTHIKTVSIFIGSQAIWKIDK